MTVQREDKPTNLQDSASTDDIVGRLRWSAASTEVSDELEPYGKLLDEAADLIERLRSTRGEGLDVASPQTEPHLSRLWRKKPVVVEAFEWTGIPGPFPVDWIQAPLREGNAAIVERRRRIGLEIATLEGTMRAEPGDWIIKGTRGELYPCKPDAFSDTFEPASAYSKGDAEVDARIDNCPDILREAACAAEKVLNEWGYKGDVVEDVCAAIMLVSPTGTSSDAGGSMPEES